MTSSRTPSPVSRGCPPTNDPIGPPTSPPESPRTTSEYGVVASGRLSPEGLLRQRSPGKAGGGPFMGRHPLPLSLAGRNLAPLPEGMGRANDGPPLDRCRHQRPVATDADVLKEQTRTTRLIKHYLTIVIASFVDHPTPHGAPLRVAAPIGIVGALFAAPRWLFSPRLAGILRSCWAPRIVAGMQKVNKRTKKPLSFRLKTLLAPSFQCTNLYHTYR